MKISKCTVPKKKGREEMEKGEKKEKRKGRKKKIKKEEEEKQILCRTEIVAA